MILKRFWFGVLGAPALALTLAACTDRPPLSPSSTAPSELLSGSASGAPNFLECLNTDELSGSFTVDALGLSYSGPGLAIAIPLNAVLNPTTFQVTVPASDYRTIEVTANGSEHYQFALPITVTVSYAHCPGAGLLSKSLRAYYVDGETGAVLEDMGGVDDKVARTVTFTTDHFSAYVLGTN